MYWVHMSIMVPLAKADQQGIRMHYMNWMFQKAALLGQRYLHYTWDNNIFERKIQNEIQYLNWLRPKGMK